MVTSLNEKLPCIWSQNHFLIILLLVYLQGFFEKVKQSNQQINVLKVEKTFTEQLDLGLKNMIFSVNLAIHGFKGLWDKYLKTALIGVKMSSVSMHDFDDDDGNDDDDDNTV